MNRARAVNTATATTVPRLVRVKFVRSFSVRTGCGVASTSVAHPMKARVSGRGARGERELNRAPTLGAVRQVDDTVRARRGQARPERLQLALEALEHGDVAGVAEQLGRLGHGQPAHLVDLVVGLERCRCAPSSSSTAPPSGGPCRRRSATRTARDPARSAARSPRGPRGPPPAGASRPARACPWAASSRRTWVGARAAPAPRRRARATPRRRRPARCRRAPLDAAIPTCSRQRSPSRARARSTFGVPSEARAPAARNRSDHDLDQLGRRIGVELDLDLAERHLGARGATVVGRHHGPGAHPVVVDLGQRSSRRGRRAPAARGPTPVGPPAPAAPPAEERGHQLAHRRPGARRRRSRCRPRGGPDRRPPPPRPTGT